MLRSIAFVIEGIVTTQVRVTGNLDGTLSFEFTRLGAGSVGDLGAVFLDLNRAIDGDGFRVYGDAGLTEGAIVKEGVDMLGRAARITRAVVDELGDFDISIVFGALASGRGAVRRTGFTLAHETAPLTLDMIDLADFGLRFTASGGQSGDVSGPRAFVGGAHAAAVRDALEVIEIQAAQASPLARDGNGGVLAVIDLQDERHALRGAAIHGEDRAAYGAGGQTRAAGARPDRPHGWDGLHPLV